MSQAGSGALGDYVQALTQARLCSDRGAWAEATQLWERVAAANPGNGNNWESLAHACFAAGRYRRAIDAYRKVDELGVTAARDEIVAPGAIAYRIACCHARLGDPDSALSALADALDHGYRDLDRALQDEHLAPVRKDPRFAALVGLDRAGHLSRDDAWRLDVSLLAREIGRRSPQGPRAGPEVPAEDVERLIAAVPELTDAQIVVELTRWVARLDDGHGFVEASEEDAALSRQLPVQFYLFEEGLYITGAEPEYRSLLGTRVLSFDGRATGAVLAAVDPLISRDNSSGARERMVQVLRRLPVLNALGLTDHAGAVELGVQADDGVRRQIAVAAGPGRWVKRNELPAPAGWMFYPETLLTPLPLYLRNCSTSYWFEHLPDERLVYLQLNSISDDPAEPLAAFADRVFRFIDEHDVHRLVIDMRWNGGGNLFLVAPLVHGLMSCPKVNRHRGLFVIIGRRTFSAAQYTCTAIEASTHAIFVGEPTGSRPNFVGETTPFMLPYSKLRVNVSDMYWQNSWPLDRRTAIAPELYVAPTFAAYRDNRDPALEAILACAENLPPA